MRDDLGVLVEELEEALRQVRGRQGAAPRASSARWPTRRPPKKHWSEPPRHGRPLPTSSAATSARSALRIGPIALRSPVVLAPMAGVTNVAFRTLCRELELSRAGTVSGLYVCEMVTARALVERHPVTMHMTTFAPDESPRSLQLYTVDPDTTYAAAKMIADEGLADHIDMNFGCPVPKVTRRGGGAALPFKRRLFGQIVAAAVRRHRRHRHSSHGEVPHRHRRRPPHPPRCRADRRSRKAPRQSPCTPAPPRSATPAPPTGTRSPHSKQHVTDIPVLGNGDIFDAGDALAMMAATGLRRCRYRPRLPGSAVAVRRAVRRVHRRVRRPPRPRSARSRDIIRRHGELLAAPLRRGQGHARHPQARRVVPARVPRRSRPPPGIGAGQDPRELDDLLDQLGPGRAVSAGGRAARGGVRAHPRRWRLPEGWLDDPDDCTVPVGADAMHSGG